MVFILYLNLRYWNNNLRQVSIYEDKVYISFSALRAGTSSQ